MATQEWKEIEPLALGKVLGLVGFILGFILAVFGLIIGSFAQTLNLAPMTLPVVASVAELITVPILYLVTGFIMGIVGGYTYNLVAKKIGGIKVRT